MLLVPNHGSPGRGATSGYIKIYSKACLRRSKALLALGVISGAQADQMEGGLSLQGSSLQEQASMKQAFLLGTANRYPIRYGMGHMPPKPAPRSTVSAFDRVETIKQAKLPRNCLFMSASVWEFKVYLFEGKDANMGGMKYSDKLLCFNPGDGLVKELSPTPDASGPKEHKNPFSRCGYASQIFQGCLYIWGGEPDFFQYGTVNAIERGVVWKVDLTKEKLRWERIKPKGPAPSARYDFTHAVHNYNGRMIIFGGREGSDEGDTWAFDFNTHKWSLICAEYKLVAAPIKPKAPEARFPSAGWVVDDRLYIFSGAAREQGLSSFGDDFNFAETWRLNRNTKTWELVLDEGAVPCARAEMGYAASYKGVCYFVGGCTSACPSVEGVDANGTPVTSYKTSYLNEILEFSPATGWWRTLRTEDMQGALGKERSGMAAWVNGVLYTFGGYIGRHECREYNKVKCIKFKTCCVCEKDKEDTGRLYQCGGCKEKGGAA